MKQRGTTLLPSDPPPMTWLEWIAAGTCCAILGAVLALMFLSSIVRMPL